MASQPGARTPEPVIGLFDSGIGGLSVWQEVARRMPGYSTVYLADNAHCPYGPRSVEEVRRFSLAIGRFLAACGAGVVVVACNTASAAALESLRAELDVPVVGMEPAVKPAAERTRTGHVGILATRGTLNGRLFRDTSARYAGGVTVHVRIGEGLVERVEAGQVEAPETAALLKGYLEPMLEAGVDQIVLGCTHYAFLVPLMQTMLPPGVSLIDPAAPVARRVQEVLSLQACRPRAAPAGPRPPAGGWRFYSTGPSAVLEATLRRLTGRLPNVESVRWDGAETYIDRDGQYSGT
jgi:glutamate racemase